MLRLVACLLPLAIFAQEDESWILGQNREYCLDKQACGDEGDCEWNNVEGECCNYQCGRKTKRQWGESCYDDGNQCSDVECRDGSQCNENTYTCDGRVGWGCTCQDDDDCGEGEDSACVAYQCLKLQLAHGTACTSYLQCLSGSCSGGICVGIAYGQECEDNKDVKASSCGTGLYCNDGACAYRVAVGNACQGDEWDDCMDGYYCNLNTYTCQERQPAGEYCLNSWYDEWDGKDEEDTISSCETGLLCNAQKCAVPFSLDAGDDCTTSWACKQGLFCPADVDQQDDNGNAYFSQCQAPHSVGYAQACTHSQQCPLYSTCDETCGYNSKGSVCANDEDCAYGLACGCDYRCEETASLKLLQNCSLHAPDFFMELAHKAERFSPDKLSQTALESYIGWRCCLACSPTSDPDAMLLASQNFRIPLATDMEEEDIDIIVSGGYVIDCDSMTLSEASFACENPVDPPAISTCKVPTQAPTPPPTAKVVVEEEEPTKEGPPVTTAVGLLMLLAVVGAACCVMTVIRRKSQRQKDAVALTDANFANYGIAELVESDSEEPWGEVSIY
mmetsp:Transcript_6729/g.7505  ORF Transcript_6729/g.7505 Transcript_6729/m.7505 type:complete len:560 (-) Transcript_6729:177-1856(-)